MTPQQKRRREEQTEAEDRCANDLEQTVPYPYPSPGDDKHEPAADTQRNRLAKRHPHKCGNCGRGPKPAPGEHDRRSKERRQPNAYPDCHFFVVVVFRLLSSRFQFGDLRPRLPLAIGEPNLQPSHFRLCRASGVGCGIRASRNSGVLGLCSTELLLGCRDIRFRADHSRFRRTEIGGWVSPRRDSKHKN